MLRRRRVPELPGQKTNSSAAPARRRAVPQPRLPGEMVDSDAEMDSNYDSEGSASSLDADIERIELDAAAAAAAYLLSGPSPKSPNRSPETAPTAKPPAPAPNITAAAPRRSSPTKCLSPVVETEEPEEPPSDFSEGEAAETEVAIAPLPPTRKSRRSQPGTPARSAPSSPRPADVVRKDSKEVDVEMDRDYEEQVDKRPLPAWTPSQPSSFVKLTSESSLESKTIPLAPKRRRKWRIALLFLSFLLVVLAAFLTFSVGLLALKLIISLTNITSCSLIQSAQTRRTFLRHLTDFQDSSAKQWTLTRRNSLRALEKLVG